MCTSDGRLDLHVSSSVTDATLHASPNSVRPYCRFENKNHMRKSQDKLLICQSYETNDTTKNDPAKSYTYDAMQ